MTATRNPPPAPAPRRWTREEYRRLGELGFFAGQRVELVRGEIVAMSPIGSGHMTGVSLTADALHAAFGPGYYTRVQGPLQLGQSEPLPDVAIVAGKPRDYADAHPSTALLVVEVADSTLAYDLTVKAELYAEAGVADYWVLDLAARCLHVLRGPRPLAPGGHAYRDTRVLAEAGAVAPLAAPGSPITVRDLLP